jgi:hypothetical protein
MNMPKNTVGFFIINNSYHKNSKYFFTELEKHYEPKSKWRNIDMPLNFKNCLCCGSPTLKSEIHDICSKCDWQDDPAAWNNIDDDNNANGIPLRKARINYELTGNCDGIDIETPGPIQDLRYTTEDEEDKKTVEEML